MSKKKPFKVISLEESGRKEFFVNVLKDGKNVIIKVFQYSFSEKPTDEMLEYRQKFKPSNKKWFFEAVENVLNHETKLSEEEIKVVGELFSMEDGSITPNFDY